MPSEDDSEGIDIGSDESVDILERPEDKVKKPDMYKVVLHNDDYTTKEFVVQVLAEVFHKSFPEATNIMLRAHRHGKAVVEVYTFDIAQTKVKQVHQKAKQKGYPLRCSVEPE
jgi:ATP-dependent Clp protease adaptor protein ClpS